MMDAEWMALPLEEEEEPDLSFPPESRTCFTGSDNLKEGVVKFYSLSIFSSSACY